MKLQIILIVIATILIGFHIWDMGFEDMSLENNWGTYCGIFAMICLIIQNFLNIRDKRKEQT